MRRVLDWTLRHGREPHSVYFLSALSVGDFFIPALPTQTSVIALGLLQPKRWILIALAFSLAAVLGASVLILLVFSVESYLAALRPAPSSDVYAHWTSLQQIISDYGLWGLLAFSMFPTPPRLMVATTLLAGFSIPLILGTVFAGKLIWFGLTLAVVRYTPQALRRVPPLARLIHRIDGSHKDHDNKTALQ